MTDQPIILQIIVAVIAGCGGLSTTIVMVLKWLRSRRSRKMDDGYSHIFETFEHLQKLLAATSAARIMVAKSENGGGLPRPGSVVTSSVVYEVFDKRLESLREIWQRIPLDQEYSQAISLVSAGQWYWRKRSNMQAQSVLKDLIEDDVQLVCFARICGTQAALWYIAVHFCDRTEIADSERAEIVQTLFKLRTVFARHYDLIKNEGTI